MVYKIFNLTFNIEQFKMLVKDQLFYRMMSGEVYFSKAPLAAMIIPSCFYFPDLNRLVAFFSDAILLMASYFLEGRILNFTIH